MALQAYLSKLGIDEDFLRQVAATLESVEG